MGHNDKIRGIYRLFVPLNKMALLKHNRSSLVNATNLNLTQLNIGHTDEELVEWFTACKTGNI